MCISGTGSERFLGKEQDVQYTHQPHAFVAQWYQILDKVQGLQNLLYLSAPELNLRRCWSDGTN